MVFLPSPPQLPPYLLLAPGLAWLALFFLVPSRSSLPVPAVGGLPELRVHMSSRTSRCFSATRAFSARSSTRHRDLRAPARVPARHWSRSAPVPVAPVPARSSRVLLTYLIRSSPWLNILATRARSSLPGATSTSSSSRGRSHAARVVAGIPHFFPFMAWPLYVAWSRSLRAPGRRRSLRGPAAGVHAPHAFALRSGIVAEHCSRPPAGVDFTRGAARTRSNRYRERALGEVPGIARLPTAHRSPRPRRSPRALRLAKLVCSARLTVEAFYAPLLLRTRSSSSATILPIAVVILFSFNKPPSFTTSQEFRSTTGRVDSVSASRVRIKSIPSRLARSSRPFSERSSPSRSSGTTFVAAARRTSSSSSRWRRRRSCWGLRS